VDRLLQISGMENMTTAAAKIFHAVF